MDTAQAEEFASVLNQRRDEAGEKVAQIDAKMSSLDAIWQGADAESFRARWNSVHGHDVQRLLDLLLELSREVQEQAQQQDVASAAGAGESVGERADDFAPRDGIEWSDVPGYFVPTGWQGGIGVANSLAGGAQSLYQSVGEMADDAVLGTRILYGDDAAAAMSQGAQRASAISRGLGIAGGAVTVGMSAYDRWQEDASDPSLSDGERVARAGADAGANLLGGVAGAKAGLAAGAAIGSIFPGPGTVIGGAVGAAVGGFLGGSAGDAVIDWVLG